MNPPKPPGSNFWILKLTALVILIAVFAYGQTQAHEDAHKQIMIGYGCKNVTVELNWDLSGSAKCEDLGRIKSDQERFLHGLNEIVGYQADVITAMIMILVCFLSISFYTRRPY